MSTTTNKDYAVTARGAAVAFAAGALLASGYAHVDNCNVHVWRCPFSFALPYCSYRVYRRLDDKNTVRAAAAGGAFNLGLYLWVPAAFRDVWLYRRR